MKRSGRYGVLNLVIHPHPEGTYRRLFEKAGEDNFGVRFYGDRFATLSKVTKTRNGVFTGRLATWTEIDEKSNLIEKATLKESLLSDSDVSLPEGVGFNSRVFSFAFRVDDHTIYCELLNDERQSISIGMTKKAFKSVFESIRGDEIDEMEIHISSRKNAVEQILAIPKIKKIEIKLDLPNPDDLGPQKMALLAELEGMHAQKLKAEITRSSGQPTLILTERYRAMADLAKDNGYVVGTGTDDDGQAIRRSTREYPNEIDALLGQDESRAFATRRIAELGDDN